MAVNRNKSPKTKLWGGQHEVGGKMRRNQQREDLEGIARGRKSAEVGILEDKQGKDFKKEKFNCQMLLMGYLRKNYKVLCK